MTTVQNWQSAQNKKLQRVDSAIREENSELKKQVHQLQNLVRAVAKSGASNPNKKQSRRKQRPEQQSISVINVDESVYSTKSKGTQPQQRQTPKYRELRSAHSPLRMSYDINQNNSQTSQKQQQIINSVSFAPANHQSQLKENSPVQQTNQRSMSRSISPDKCQILCGQQHHNPNFKRCKSRSPSPSVVQNQSRTTMKVKPSLEGHFLQPKIEVNRKRRLPIKQRTPSHAEVRKEQYPRLNFATEFKQIILQGQKTATTRLKGENDPTTDLAHLHVGTRCVATADCVPFAHLIITRVQTKLYDEIDNELALIENCHNAQELKQLLKKFYPNIKANSIIKVYHFQLRNEHQQQQRAGSARPKRVGAIGRQSEPKLDFSGHYGPSPLLSKREVFDAPDNIIEVMRISPLVKENNQNEFQPKEIVQHFSATVQNYVTTPRTQSHKISPMRQPQSSTQKPSEQQYPSAQTSPLYTPIKTARSTREQLDQIHQDQQDLLQNLKDKVRDLGLSNESKCVGTSNQVSPNKNLQQNSPATRKNNCTCQCTCGGGGGNQTEFSSTTNYSELFRQRERNPLLTKNRINLSKQVLKSEQAQRRIPFNHNRQRHHQQRLQQSTQAKWCLCGRVLCQNQDEE